MQPVEGLRPTDVAVDLADGGLDLRADGRALGDQARETRPGDFLLALALVA